jgi:hypothetical protein
LGNSSGMQKMLVLAEIWLKFPTVEPKAQKDG